MKTLLKVIHSTISETVEFNFTDCLHKDTVKRDVINFCKVIIYNYINGANSIMYGKDCRQKDNFI